MEKLSIKEVIVVEGKSDATKIESCVKADILISNGTHVSKDFLKLCKRINDTRGLVIFTDPDSPGEMIRTKIIDYVGTTKHASLSVKQAKSSKKVGVEHATCEDIIEALRKSVTFDVNIVSISHGEFYELGLSGGKASQALRDKISAALSIPICNSKRMFKYLNMLGIDKIECERILKGDINGSNL
jgi:ribonuclease M5